MFSFCRALKVVFIFVNLFLTHDALAQRNPEKVLNKFTGTWVGGVIKNFDGIGPKKIISIAWRIHKIDNSRNQIELTEISPLFTDSTTEVGNPNKVILEGHDDGEVLVLLVVDRPTGNKIIIKLKAEYDEGTILLNGIVERTQDRKDCYAFKLVKVSSDTSAYVKPNNDGIKIDIIQRPYQIERKPSLN
nr:hypothetical protein [Pedobacter panaciterrae]